MNQEFKSALTNVKADELIKVTINNKVYKITLEDLQDVCGGETGLTVLPDSGINLRSSPSLSSQILIRIPKGSGVILISNQIIEANGFHWLNIKYNGVTGWCAGEYLSNLPPTPKPSSEYKFGLHVYLQTDTDLSQDANNKLIHTAEKLYNQKKPMSFTVLNDIDLANRLQPFAKVLIFRPYISETIELNVNAQNQGGAWVRQHQDSFSKLVKANNVYIQMTNENDNCNQKDPNFGKFYLGILMELDKFGRKGVAFNDSVGNPDLNHIDTRRETIQYCINNNHVIGYHGYGKLGLNCSDHDPDNIKYYSRRYEWLYKDYPNARIVLNECGRWDATFISTDNTVKDMEQFNHDLLNDNRVICFNWWQYNGQGTPDWNKSALNNSLASIESMIVNYK